MTDSVNPTWTTRMAAPVVIMGTFGLIGAAEAVKTASDLANEPGTRSLFTVPSDKLVQAYQDRVSKDLHAIGDFKNWQMMANVPGHLEENKKIHLAEESLDTARSKKSLISIQSNMEILRKNPEMLQKVESLASEKYPTLGEHLNFDPKARNVLREESRDADLRELDLTLQEAMKEAQPKEVLVVDRK